MMKEILELVWGVIRRPTSTFKKIEEKKPFGVAVAVVFIYGALPTLWILLTSQEIPLGAKRMAPLFPVIWLLLWVVASAFLQTASKRLKGKGTFKDTLLVVGIAHIILLLTGGFCSILFRLIQIKLPIVRALGGLTNIWFITVLTIGIREIQRFTTRKAIGSLVVTVLYIGVVWFITSASRNIFVRLFR